MKKVKVKKVTGERKDRLVALFKMLDGVKPGDTAASEELGLQFTRLR